METKVENHKRENDILLGFLERPALQWLAAHSPSWVTPDLLTWTGVMGAILVFISYGLTHINRNFLWLAIFGFLLNWLGDSLDGTLARYRHVERPRYGFLVDHSVDAMTTVLMFIGIGLSPYVDLLVASFAVIAYLLVSIMVYLTTYVTGVFKITSAKVGPTEIRVLAILLTIFMFFNGINTIATLPYFGGISIYTLTAGLLAIALGIYFIVNSAINIRKLALLDGKRLERKQAENTAKNKDSKDSNAAHVSSES